MTFYSVWYLVVVGRVSASGNVARSAVKYHSYAPEDGQKIARNMLS